MTASGFDEVDFSGPAAFILTVSSPKVEIVEAERTHFQNNKPRI